MNTIQQKSGSSVLYIVEDDIPTLSYRPSSSSSSTSATTSSTFNSYQDANVPPVIRKIYEQNTFIDWSLEKLLIPRMNSLHGGGNRNININNNCNNNNNNDNNSNHNNSTLQYGFSKYVNVSKKWLTVLLSAVILGYVASAIDLISVSLNDLKKGLCLPNKQTKGTDEENGSEWSIFNPYLTCPTEDWYSWLRLLFGTTAVWGNVLVNFPVYLLLAMAFVAGAAFLTINREHLIRQSGIPEIKLIISGFNMNLEKYLGIKTLLYKITGLILVVSSGLWLGKEGPLVHVACCIFNIVHEVVVRFNARSSSSSMRQPPRINEAIRREILSAATATGISVAFNSPIGGVLFVLESMPSYFYPTKIIWISFVSATVAIIGMTGFNSFTDGRNSNFLEQDLFQVNFGNFSWLFMEVVPFCILGFIGGVYGSWFIKLNQKLQNQHFRKRIQLKIARLCKVDAKYGAYLELLLLVTVTTILNFPLEIAKLPLNSYLKLLFKECPKTAVDQPNATNFLCLASNGMTLIKLLYIVIQGFLLTACTFGIDLPGGILMPSLVLGASTGRLFGILSQALQSKFHWESLATCTEKSCVVSPSSYAVIGAASFMTGITKLTMTVVVLMFEITGAVTYVLPIMCGVMTAKFVNDWLTPSNIYDTWLQNNYNQPGDKDFHGLVNEGKGTGLVSFSNLTTTIKSKLPDVTVKSLMIPVAQMKCLCLIGGINGTPYTRTSLTTFVSEDSHEGYPLISDYEDPVYLGYVNKSELLQQLFNLDQQEHEDLHRPISFQVENLPKSALSKQLHYERQLTDFIALDLKVERSKLYTNDLSPAVLILEEFEKLHLNHLVILRQDNAKDEVMAGFIDRFILSTTINDKFRALVDELDDFEAINSYDLETAGILNERDNDEGLDEWLSLRQNRKSIELIT